MVILEQILVIEAPIERCFDLARSIDLHLLANGQRREETVAASGGVTSGLIGLGQTVTWRARHFGVRQTLTTKITAFDSPNYFQDTMVRGIFQSMQHDHFFRAIDGNRTEMRDMFRFAAPLPVLGLFAETLVLRRYMTHFLRERNTVLKQIAESGDYDRYLQLPGSRFTAGA